MPGLVKEQLLVYIQKEFGTGMLDVYDCIDKEAMIDLNKELPVVRTSNNSMDAKIAENENKAYMYEFRDDMKYEDSQAKGSCLKGEPGQGLWSDLG
jgi:hypothetical protein